MRRGSGGCRNMRCDPGRCGDVRGGAGGRHAWGGRRSRDGRGGMRNRGNRMRSGRGARRGSGRGSLLRRLRHCLGGERKRNHDQDRCDAPTYSTHVFLPP
jgi:hypothetical protein